MVWGEGGGGGVRLVGNLGFLIPLVGVTLNTESGVLIKLAYD